MSLSLPCLSKQEYMGAIYFTDKALLESEGVALAFTTRSLQDQEPSLEADKPFSGLNMAPLSTCLRALPLDKQEELSRLYAADKDAYLTNRSLVLEALGLDAHLACMSLEQVHGKELVCVADHHEEIARRLNQGLGLANFAQADGLVLSPKDKLAGILCYADCVPLIIVSPNKELSLLHSGWKGSAAHILSEGAKALAQRSSCEISEMNLYIGPHIYWQDYPVSFSRYQEFCEAFKAFEGADKLIALHESLSLEASVSESGGADKGAANKELGNAGRQYYLNLLEALRFEALNLGFSPKRICFCGEYTSKDSKAYFSYRLQDGLCGRIAAIAGFRDS